MNLGPKEKRAIARVEISPEQLTGLLATRAASGVSLDQLIEARIAGGVLTRSRRRGPEPVLTQRTTNEQRLIRSGAYERTLAGMTSADLDAARASAIMRGDLTIEELNDPTDEGI